MQMTSRGLIIILRCLEKRVPVVRPTSSPRGKFFVDERDGRVLGVHGLQNPLVGHESCSSPKAEARLCLRRAVCKMRGDRMGIYTAFPWCFGALDVCPKAKE